MFAMSSPAMEPPTTMAVRIIRCLTLTYAAGWKACPSYLSLSIGQAGVRI
jgi:hypothetical protein